MRENKQMSLKASLNILRTAKISQSFMLFLFILGIASSLLSTLPPVIIGALTTAVTQLTQNDSALLLIAKHSGALFAVIVLGSIVRNYFCYLTSINANKIIKRLRDLTFDKLLNTTNFKESTGYYVNMINSNTQRLELVFSNALFTLVSDVFDLIWIAIFLVAIDYRIPLILFCFFPFIYMLGLKSGRIQRKLAVKKIEEEKNIISKICESFSNLAIIRVFNGKSRELNLFGKLTGSYEKISNRSDLATSLFFVLEKSIRYIAIISVIALTTYRATIGLAEIGVILTVVMLSENFYSPLTSIVRYIQMVQKGLAGAEEINNYLLEPYNDADTNIKYEDTGKLLIARSVSMAECETIMLPPTYFEITENTINLLTGDSGSGKTTLINALIGVKPLSEGTFCINSKLEQAESLFSYASQNAELFSISVLDNVLYPRTVETVLDDELFRAKQILITLGFGEAMLYKHAGEEGCNLSGGERKRIALARALFNNAPILVLDEATTNLDHANEQKALELIAKEAGKRTIILVSHNTSTQSMLDVPCKAILIGGKGDNDGLK